MRGRLAGSAWRTALPLARGGEAGAFLSSSAAWSSRAVSSTMRSNNTAWVLVSRLSPEAPKRQRLSRASSKFSASILVCLNFNSPCSCWSNSRSSCTVCCAPSDTVSDAVGVSVVLVGVQALEHGPNLPRARAEGLVPYGQTQKLQGQIKQTKSNQTTVIDCVRGARRRCHGRPAASPSNCSRVRTSEPESSRGHSKPPACRRRVHSHLRIRQTSTVSPAKPGGLLLD